MSVETGSAAAPVLPSPHRPGLRALAMMVRCELRMVVRDTAGLLVPLGLPLLILLTSSGGAAQTEMAAGRTALDLVVLPMVLVMVLSMIGVLNMPSFLAYYRRAGILRRLAVTPASPMLVLAAQVIVSLIQSLVGMALAGAVAVLAFGAGPPERPLAALGVLVLITAAMYATGMIVAAVSPTPNSAVAIGLGAFLLLGASGGMFGGLHALPEPIARVGVHLPFGAGVDALSTVWAGQDASAAPLLSLAVAAVVGTGVGAGLFRWQ